MVESSFLHSIRQEGHTYQEGTLSMDEQKKCETIKGLLDHPETANKDRAALSLGCTRRHVNRMIKGYQKDGKEFFSHGRRDEAGAR